MNNKYFWNLKKIGITATLAAIAILFAGCADGNSGGESMLDPNADNDGDGIINGKDVDDDNDGLIDIYTLTQLNNVRYNLAGTGYQTSSSTTPVTTGAPTARTVNCRTTPTNMIYLCGYELMNDLNFDTDRDGTTFTFTVTTQTMAIGDPQDAYYNGGSGWDPIGRCVSSSRNCDNGGFTGIFEGNGHTISNLYINHSGTAQYGTGLFAGATKRIQNLRLKNIYVENKVTTDNNIGGLVGNGRVARIVNCYATGIVKGDQYIGGLIGDSEVGTIISSRFQGSVTGRSHVGGLVGRGATVIGSYTTGDENDIVRGSALVGGLMGEQGQVGDPKIVASYATLNVLIDAPTNAGGLLGSQLGTIVASYATGNVDGSNGNSDNIGGLVGFFSRTTKRIIASYATGNVNGHGGNSDDVGGLVGSQANGSIIASYATGNADGGAGTTDKVGKLVGSKTDGTITKSYGFGLIVGEEEGESPDLPAGVSTAANLTAMNTNWNTTSGSLNAWDFGDSTQAPALRFAEYDGDGGTNYCGRSRIIPTKFADGSAITCGADSSLIPGQR